MIKKAIIRIIPTAPDNVKYNNFNKRPANSQSAQFKINKPTNNIDCSLKKTVHIFRDIANNNIALDMYIKGRIADFRITGLKIG